MNRLELFTAVNALAHRNDLATFFDTALKMGESRIAQKVRATEMIVFGNVDTGAAETYPGAWQLPSDFVELRDVILSRNGRRASLQSAPRSQMADYSGSGGTGPAFYSIYDGVIEFRPLPSGDVIDLIYFARLPALVADGDTNDVLTNYPELYIFATLAGVFTWTQSAELKADAINEFMAAADSVNTHAANQRQGTALAGYTGRSYQRRAYSRNI